MESSASGCSLAVVAAAEVAVVAAVGKWLGVLGAAGAFVHVGGLVETVAEGAEIVAVAVVGSGQTAAAALGYVELA